MVRTDAATSTSTVLGDWITLSLVVTLRVASGDVKWSLFVVSLCQFR
jgi:hypothetical protein